MYRGPCSTIFHWVTQIIANLSRRVSRESTCVLARMNKTIDPTGKNTKNIVYRDMLESWGVFGSIFIVHKYQYLLHSSYCIQYIDLTYFLWKLISRQHLDKIDVCVVQLVVFSMVSRLNERQHVDFLYGNSMSTIKCLLLKVVSKWLDKYWTVM